MDWLQQKLQALRKTEGYVVPAVNGSSPGLREALAPLKLDANENHFVSRDWLEQLASEAAREVDPRFYSIAEIEELKQALAEHFSIPPQRIVLGCGADQLIDFLVSTFLRSGAKAAALTPSYSFYRIRAGLHGGTMLEIPLADRFEFPTAAALQRAQDAHIFFLCSPNNPAGNQFKREAVLDLVEKFHGLVIVDEAYADFAPYQLVKDVHDDRSLIVLRTLSKTFGLAGLRIGYLVAPAPMAEVFIEKVQYPYPLSQFVVRLATKVVRSADTIRSAVDAMRNERDRLGRELRQIAGVTVFPSDANFILFRWAGDAKRHHLQLQDQGICLKYIGSIQGEPGFLRTTVGTSPMNDRLLDALSRSTVEA